MTKIINPLIGRFDEYMKLIEILCECYDQGNDIVALSIATAIRVLVHDTNNSKSLFAHLDIKDAEYVSTNHQITQDIVHLGIVRRINVGVINLAIK